MKRPTTALRAVLHPRHNSRMIITGYMHKFMHVPSCSDHSCQCRQPIATGTSCLLSQRHQTMRSTDHEHTTNMGVVIAAPDDSCCDQDVSHTRPPFANNVAF